MCSLLFKVKIKCNNVLPTYASTFACCIQFIDVLLFHKYLSSPLYFIADMLFEIMHHFISAVKSVKFCTLKCVLQVLGQKKKKRSVEPFVT